jgi:CubicO group peptidase (beta-lactamase class C family)
MPKNSILIGTDWRASRVRFATCIGLLALLAGSSACADLPADDMPSATGGSRALARSALRSSQSSPVAIASRAEARPPASALPRGEARYLAIRDRLARELAASGVPGGALAIIENGQLRHASGVGVKQAGATDPVDGDTRFRIGSITKTFTATLAAQLAAERKLSLDAPIVKYVPELHLAPQHDPRAITLRQLLSHTAGVPDHVEWTCEDGPGELGRWFAEHPNLTLWSPPGRLWNYSNLGYSLAGLAIERAAGMPFRELASARIFAPLGLSSMTFDSDVAIAGNHAVATTADDSLDYTSAECALTDPPGYLWSSVRDLGRFVETLLFKRDYFDRRVAPQLRSAIASTQAPPDLYYGLGLMLSRRQHVTTVGHNGGLPGYRSAFMAAPERGTAVVILINGEGYDPLAGALRALDDLLALPAEAPRDWSTEPSDWARYVGVYSEAADAGAFPEPQIGTVAVELEADKLYLRIEGEAERFALTQYARDTWIVTVEGAPVLLTFIRDRRGHVEYIATRLGVVRRVE